MKIGFDVKPFNYNLRSTRQEWGLTQKQLGNESNTNTEFIGTLELLKMPVGKIWTIKEKMNRVARCLEVDFHWLFPQDYLDAIQHEILPRRREPLIWVKEVNILQFSDSEQFALPSPEDDVLDMNIREGTVEGIHVALNLLSDRAKEVMEMRFGIGRDEPMTLEAVGEVLGVSVERIRQIEGKALCRLRHPNNSAALRELGLR